MADKYIWRFQADVIQGDKDPPVTVFLGELETYDGRVSIRQDTRDPVTLKLSEMVSMLAAPPARLATLQEKQMAERKAAENVGSEPNDE